MTSSDGGTRQSAFTAPETRIRRALEMASRHEYDVVIGLVSGGTDSLAAVDAMWRCGPEYGIELDAVLHANTGAGLPCTRETVQEWCADRGVAYLEGLNQKPGEMLAHRVLEHGWPAAGQGAPGDSGGHQMEYINRKERVFERAYARFSGRVCYVSGARVNESDRRAGTMGDGAVDHRTTGDRYPRLTWVSPMHGLLDDEVDDYVSEYDIPETPAYDWLHYSGDCVACSYDDPRVVNEIALIAPELAYALRHLVVWVYNRIRAGQIDIPIHRCVWGWDRDLERDGEESDGEDASLDSEMFRRAGCATCSKRAVADGGDEFGHTAERGERP